MLVVNAGSTSTKLAIVETTTWSRGRTPPMRATTRWRGAFDDAGDALDDVTAVGHRIVHGGAASSNPSSSTTSVVAEIESLTELAPLHNRPGLAGIRAVAAKLPDLPQVACFDTAFHATMPDAARVRRAAPMARRRLRRYGFHGLSHEHATTRSVALLGRAARRRAVGVVSPRWRVVDRRRRPGRSIDTTMGFTPLDGLVMATRRFGRPRAAPPPAPARRVRVEELDDMLERRSGVLGLSGSERRLREVIAARDRGDEQPGSRSTCSSIGWSRGSER